MPKEDNIEDSQADGDWAGRPTAYPDSWEEDSPKARSSDEESLVSQRSDERRQCSPPEFPKVFARDQATAPEPRSSETAFPPVPKLKSLECRSVIQAWFTDLEQLRSQRGAPAWECLRWAVASLKGEAARVWENRLTLLCDEAPTLLEMKETFLRHHREWYSVYSL